MIALVWSAVWAVVKSWGAKVLKWCCKPPGEYVAMAVLFALAIWADQSYGYHRGYAASDASWRPKFAAAQSAVKTEKANQGALQAALTKQNAAITALGAKTYASLAAAAKIQSEKDAKIKALEEQSGVYLAAPPAGSTLCSRYEAVYNWVLRGEKK